MTNTDKILEEVLKIAVDRFLGWKLPKDFQPDGGISFKSGVCETIGTHLFTAQQANEMLKYVLEEALTTKITQALAEERSKAWEGEAVKQAYIQGKSQAIAEERERVVKGLLKEYKGQESQIQDAVNYISSLDKSPNSS